MTENSEVNYHAKYSVLFAQYTELRLRHESVLEKWIEDSNMRNARIAELKVALIKIKAMADANDWVPDAKEDLDLCGSIAQAALDTESVISKDSE